MRAYAVAAALLLSSLVAGCMTAQERAAARNAQDDAKCLSYGAQKGSDAYVQCRTQLDTTRTMAASMPAPAPAPVPAFSPPPAPVTCLRTGNMVTCN